MLIKRSKEHVGMLIATGGVTGREVEARLPPSSCRIPQNKMSDDKDKKKIDGWFLSLTEKYEVDYFVRDIIKQVPGTTKEQVMEALSLCVEKIQPSEGRAKIEACVLARLRANTTVRPDQDDRPKHPNRTHA